MSQYRTSAPQVTRIQDLPELEDLDNPYTNPYQKNSRNQHAQEIEYPDEKNKFVKFIRKRHQVPVQSGMDHRMVHRMDHTMDPNSQNLHRAQLSPNDNFEYEHYNDTSQVKNKSNIFQMPLNSPSCLDVASHIESCPICSKLYNADKTIYIIAIVVLSIICLLLLKKVLDEHS